MQAARARPAQNLFAPPPKTLHPYRVTNNSIPAQQGDNTMRKNGLTYTKMGLAVLFGYLLLGDFCLQMMEMLIPSIMPLQMGAAGAPDIVKSIMLISMVSLFNLTLNPLVSFTSDNVRTAWGRRRPFLLIATPFVSLALVAIAYAPEIAAFWKTTGWRIHWLEGIMSNDPSMGTLMVVLALCIVFFQLFHYIMAPVFFYLFVDVVPDAHMGRFVALFRVVATFSAFLFSTYIYPHAMSHTKEIYVGISLLYGVGLMVMSLGVREGSYAPPSHDLRNPPLEQVKAYARECYSRRHYLLFYLRNTFLTISEMADIFLVFYFTKAISVTLHDIGRVVGYTQLIILVVLYPIGMLMDKYKPTRVMFWLMVFCLPLPLLCFLFVQDRPSFLVWGFLYCLLRPLMANLALALYASIPPQERYGQFGSANQMFISVIVIPVSVLLGMLMDTITVGGTRPEMYRWCYVWNFAFYSAALFFMWLLYRSWKHYGGDNYVPPPVGLDAVKPVPVEAVDFPSLEEERDERLEMPTRE